MKKLWMLPIFAFGILVGWSARGGGTSQPQAEISQVRPTKAQRPQERAVEKSGHDAKWQVFGKRAKDLKDKEMDAVVNQLPPNDRMSAIGALAAQAGLWGLNSNVRSMMEKILATWADENFDEAWISAQNEKNPDLRNFMMKRVLDKLSDKDPDRAFAIHLEQKAIDPDFNSNAQDRFLSAKLQLGAEEFLGALSQTKFGNSSTGLNLENFPDDFDYRMLADGLSKLLKEHQYPAQFPTSFYMKWARKDPEAVYAWWAGNTSPPFSDLNKIIEGIESRAPSSSVGWIASKLQEPDAPRKKIIEELSNSSAWLAKTNINSIAQALPDEAASDTFLTEILVTNRFGDSAHNYEYVLGGLSSPEARLKAFQQMAEKHNTPRIEGISDAQLQTWGVTREQVRQALGKQD